MPHVLRSLPYFSNPTPIIAPSVNVTALGYQVIVWVSLTRVTEPKLRPDAPRFPAILDTGFSGTFSMSPIHLRQWTGLSWQELVPNGTMFFEGIEVPMRRAFLWLHPNLSGQRDEIDGTRRAYNVALDPGVAVYGCREIVGPDPKVATLTAPRLPILGLRALTHNSARLRIDTRTMTVDLALGERRARIRKSASAPTAPPTSS